MGGVNFHTGSVHHKQLALRSPYRCPLSHHIKRHQCRREKWAPCPRRHCNANPKRQSYFQLDRDPHSHVAVLIFGEGQPSQRKSDAKLSPDLYAYICLGALAIPASAPAAASAPRKACTDSQRCVKSEEAAGHVGFVVPTFIIPWLPVARSAHRPNISTPIDPKSKRNGQVQTTVPNFHAPRITDCPTDIADD